jgi:dihydrofolate reductase
MKIVQSNYTSLNGLLAREDGREDWLPDDGQLEFIENAKQYRNFIMGRETYELVMKLYPNNNFDDVDVPYKIIVTTNANYRAPESYTVAHSPEEAKAFLESRGIEVGLLVGGGRLNSSFYAKRLVDETWITVNPFILGMGRPVFAGAEFETALKLNDVIRLSKDRVQLKYSVVSKQ